MALSDGQPGGGELPTLTPGRRIIIRPAFPIGNVELAVEDTVSDGLVSYPLWILPVPLAHVLAAMVRDAATECGA